MHNKEYQKRSRRAERTRYVVKRAIKSAKGQRLRLSVFRSSRYIYGQVIDDATMHTLVAASSLEQEFRKQDMKPVELANLVGRALGARAVGKDIKLMVADRGARRYHGRVAAFIEGVRASGVDI